MILGGRHCLLSMVYDCRPVTPSLGGGRGEALPSSSSLQQLEGCGQIGNQVAGYQTLLADIGDG